MNLRQFRLLIVIGLGAITCGAVAMNFLRPGNYPVTTEALIIVILLTLLNGESATQVFSKSDVRQATLAQDANFRHSFWVWFCIAAACFVVVNLIGISPGKMAFLGIPVTFFPNFAQHDGFALLAFGLDVAFALGHSYLFALGRAFRRSSTQPVATSNQA